MKAKQGTIFSGSGRQPPPGSGVGPYNVAIETLSPKARIDNYCRVTGYPRSIYEAEDGRIVGVWIMGNSYQVKSGYYGGYPYGYLKRIEALFPEKKRPLHIFSGQAGGDDLAGDTVDLDSKLEPTYIDDAQSLESVPVEKYDLILADPPYSVEDAQHYQPTMIKRNKVMKALGVKALTGTHVVWLDQVLPMFRKDQWSVIAVIGMVKSTNHRFRVITIFEKK